MDPVTIGVVAVVALLALKGGKKEPTQGVPGNPAEGVPATGYIDAVGPIAGSKARGMEAAAAGTMMLAGRMRDTVTTMGSSGASYVQEAAGAHVAFGLYMGGAAAGAAKNAGDFIAGKAAQTKTGQAVIDQAKKTEKEAKNAAEAAKKAATNAANAFDEANARLVNRFGWK